MARYKSQYQSNIRHPHSSRQPVRPTPTQQPRYPPRPSPTPRYQPPDPRYTPSPQPQPDPRYNQNENQQRPTPQNPYDNQNGYRDNQDRRYPDSGHPDKASGGSTTNGEDKKRPAAESAGYKQPKDRGISISFLFR